MREGTSRYSGVMGVRQFMSRLVGKVIQKVNIIGVRRVISSIRNIRVFRGNWVIRKEGIMVNIVPAVMCALVSLYIGGRCTSSLTTCSFSLGIYLVHERAC